MRWPCLPAHVPGTHPTLACLPDSRRNVCWQSERLRLSLCSRYPVPRPLCRSYTGLLTGACNLTNQERQTRWANGSLESSQSRSASWISGEEGVQRQGEEARYAADYGRISGPLRLSRPRLRSPCPPPAPIRAQEKGPGRQERAVDASATAQGRIRTCTWRDLTSATAPSILFLLKNDLFIIKNLLGTRR